MIVCVVMRLDAVSVSFLGVRVLVARSVRVAAGPMAVSNVVEENETNEVRCETEGTDNENELGLRDFLGFDESLNGFKEDGETQCDQEYAVYQSAKGLCTLPLYVVRTVSITVLYLH